jgi:hypothetical protein
VPPDRLVEEIVKEATRTKTPGPDTATGLEALVLQEVPLQTPLAQARAVMERHGFSCWIGVPDDKGVCLHCTAWRRTSTHYGDRIVVRLYYENRKVVKVGVSVDRDAWYGL